MKVNKEQKWFIAKGFRFSILWLILLFVLSLFEATRQFLGIIVLTFNSMWSITLIQVWLFRDVKVAKVK